MNGSARTLAAWAPALGLLLGASACRSTGDVETGPRTVPFELTIEGAEGYAYEVLLRELLDTTPELADSPPRKVAVDDGAWALQEFFRDRGYPFAVVDYSFDEVAPEIAPESGAEGEPDVDGQEPERPGGVRVGLLAELGPRTRLAAIELVGVQAVSSKDVRSLFRSYSEGGVEYLVRAQLDAAAAALRSLYLGRGYLAVAVEAPRIEYSADRTSAEVRVTVTEGPLFRLRAVEVSRVSPAPEVSEADLAEGWSEHIGKPYTPRVGQAIRSRVAEAHAEVGYPDCLVELERKQAADGSLTLALSIEPGQKIVIGEVEVVGNDETREAFVRSRLALKEGDTYDSRKVRDSFRALYRTGLFQIVRVELADSEVNRPLPPSSEPGDESLNERALEVFLQETASQEFYVEPGFGSYEGPRLSAGIRERNLFGSGRTGAIDASVSTKSRSVSVSGIDPWLFGSSLTGSASVFYEKRQEPSFTSQERGFRLGVSRSFGPSARATVGYQFRDASLSDIDVDAEPEAELDKDVGLLSLTATWERRDDLFYPHSGHRIRPSLEYAAPELGSQIEFLRGTHSESHYFELGETVLAASLDAGVIVPLGETDVIPLQERFFNGGENTVRSFKESQLGPEDAEGDPTGGEAFTVLSLELRRILTGNASGALFFDAGNVVPEAGDFLRFGGVRTGIGVGLRYLLPVGPVRLDVGFNPDAREDEDKWVLHLAVGMPF